MDVWKDATRRNRDTSQQLVELFVVLDSQGDVAGDDAALLVEDGVSVIWVELKNSGCLSLTTASWKPRVKSNISFRCLQ